MLAEVSERLYNTLRMRYEFDPIETIGQPAPTLAPNQQIDAMCAAGETFASNEERLARNDVLAWEIQAGRAAKATLDGGQFDPEQITELQATYERGRHAKCQLLLNSLPLLRYRLFGYKRTSPDWDFYSGTRAEVLDETASADIDDVWQGQALVLFEQALEHWDPNYGANLSTYIYQRIAPSFDATIRRNRPMKVGTREIVGALVQARVFHYLGYVTEGGDMVDGHPFDEGGSAVPVVEPFEWVEDVYDDELSNEYMPAITPSVEHVYQQNTEVIDTRVFESSLLKHLNTQEKQVITLRYGLEDGRPHNFNEIGRSMNLSRARVQFIHSKALGVLSVRILDIQEAA